jgi:prepilin-type N-terminal cleavage/methylation domain-containing protein
MALNKNDKGLTLIELLITIAVIAIVAAISVPVITNVIADSRTNSAAAMQEQAQAFIDKYESSGDWSFDTASQTFLGGIDEDGNGTVALGTVASPGTEVIDTLAVDAGQFTATVAGTTATVVAAGGTNNAGGNNNAPAGFTSYSTAGYFSGGYGWDQAASASWTPAATFVSFDANTGVAVVNISSDLNAVQINYGTNNNGVVTNIYPTWGSAMGNTGYFYLSYNGGNTETSKATYDPNTGNVTLYLDEILGANWASEYPSMVFKLAHGSADWSKPFSF